MKRNFYLAAAAMLVLAATDVKAQAVIDSDYTAEVPFDESDYAGEADVVIAGATVTFAYEAMNICGLPYGDGTSITMVDGSKIIMHNTADSWFPDPENDENIDMGFSDYLIDMNTSAVITHMPYNFIIDGAATIVCDSKCRIGGSISGAGDLTVVVGDSTVIAFDYSGFKGELTFEYRDDAEAEKVLFGSSFTGTCESCGVSFTAGGSTRCWDAIYWDMKVPNGVTLTQFDEGAGIAFSTIDGRCSIDAPGSIVFFRTKEDWTYDLESVTGGSEARTLEYYLRGNVTINKPIDFNCYDVYLRNGGSGIWVNTEEPCFVNVVKGGIVGKVSARNNEGFVGGDGIIACNIGHAEGRTAFLRPGATWEAIGDLTVNGDVTWYRDHCIEIDFGAGGASDRLLIGGTCNFQGEPEAGGAKANTNNRLWINLSKDFYTKPVAGDYKIIDANEFIYFEKSEEEGVYQNNLEIKANLFEDGTRRDSLPDGYEWNFDKFFTEGIVSILGPGYEEGNIVNEPNPIAIEKPSATDPRNLVETRIFTIEGREVDSPVKGINILRMRYEDGTIVTKKIIKIED